MIAQQFVTSSGNIWKNSKFKFLVKISETALQRLLHATISWKKAIDLLDSDGGEGVGY